MYRLAVAVKVSRTPIGAEHFFCLIPRELANLLVMQFMLDPVSSSARQRVGCRLFVSMLTWVAITRLLHNTSWSAGRVWSVLVGVLHSWRQLCVRLGLVDGLGGELVRDAPDLCLLAAFRVFDGDVDDLLLEEEELRFELEEFDLAFCLSWYSIVWWRPPHTLQDPAWQSRAVCSALRPFRHKNALLTSFKRSLDSRGNPANRCIEAPPYWSRLAPIVVRRDRVAWCWWGREGGNSPLWIVPNWSVHQGSVLRHWPSLLLASYWSLIGHWRTLCQLWIVNDRKAMTWHDASWTIVPLFEKAQSLQIVLLMENERIHTVRGFPY